MTAVALNTTSFDAAALVARVARLLPDARPLALHEPRFAGREWAYVKDCLDTGWVSSVGAYVERFESMLAKRLGVPHVVATVNGTAALHTALLLAGIGPGDEVLMPALTFVATANAAAYCGAVPHFIDSSAETLGLDPGQLHRRLAEIAECREEGAFNRETGRRLAAVVPMHVFGHPIDMDGLQDVAGRWRIPVIEDAAEALGSLYRGSPVGGLGQLGALSFNGNKIVTTGGGGAVVMRDPELAARARHLTTTAKRPHAWRYEHDQVAFNYRLPNLNAALGCAQLEQLDEFIAKKRHLAALYYAALSDMPGVEPVKEPEGCRSIYWLNAVLVPDAAARDAVLAEAHGVGLLARPAWVPMHRLPMYEACPRGDLTVTEMLEARMVCLPSGAGLTGD